MLISIAIGYVPEFARVTRASVMTIREREFVEAAKAVGATDRNIIFSQILPNAMAPLIVEVTMAIAGAILSIAGLSFLGLGIQPPLPEWGAMLTNARGYIRDAWHITVFSRSGYLDYNIGAEYHRRRSARCSGPQIKELIIEG